MRGKEHPQDDEQRTREIKQQARAFAGTDPDALLGETYEDFLTRLEQWRLDVESKTNDPAVAQEVLRNSNHHLAAVQRTLVVREREQKNAEDTEEQARKILEAQPQPRPGESYDDYNRRHSEWSREVSQEVTAPELAAEIMRRSNAEAAQITAERVPEGQIPMIYESFHCLEPGLECQVSKRAADILASVGKTLEDFAGEHLEKSEGRGKRHQARRVILTDSDSVTALMLPHKPWMMWIWESGELGENV